MTRKSPCRTTRHCADHDWCHRCDPQMAEVMDQVNEIIQSGEMPGWMYSRISRVLLGRPESREAAPAGPWRGPRADLAVTDEIQGLPAWSGDFPVCAKCSNNGAAAAYRKSGERPENSGPGSLGETWPERLERRCSRCGYRWDEQINPPQ